MREPSCFQSDLAAHLLITVNTSTSSAELESYFPCSYLCPTLTHSKHLIGRGVTSSSFPRWLGLPTFINRWKCSGECPVQSHRNRSTQPNRESPDQLAFKEAQAEAGRPVAQRPLPYWEPAVGCASHGFLSRKSVVSCHLGQSYLETASPATPSLLLPDFFRVSGLITDNNDHGKHSWSL